MTRYFFILIAGLCWLPAVHSQEIKVMSYNIRLDVESDGDNQWSKRKDKVAALMNYYEADFIGAQEVQHHQLQYLSGELKKYSFIGVGRDDGKTGGEYSCIFYNNTVFSLIQQSTFWLSQTPDTVSMGWDAACKRVCTYGLFQSRKSKALFWVFNTHLDHMGATARIESVKLIMERISQLNRGKSYPVVLMGDFNSKPMEAPSQYMHKVLLDARAESKQAPYGPADTWNGFHFDQKPDGCIDYIFINRHPKLSVIKFTTITDSYDMKYPSDHFPVMATLKID